MFKIANETEFYESLTREAIKATSGKWQEWIETAKKILGRFTPSISVGSTPETDFKISFRC